MRVLKTIEEKTKQFARDLFKAIDAGLERKKLDSFKREECARLGLANAPKNHVLLKLASKRKKVFYKNVLMKTPVRSFSGVSVVAVMPKYFNCPGSCTYCPTSSIAPKSYTGFEPAALRARQHGFDAFKQVQSRLMQFIANGHVPSKCELIIMGGTFNSFPVNYQKAFVKDCFDAFNNKKSKNLLQAQKLNERAKHRVIGLTFETRPDWATKAQVSNLLDFGATRIELGVQSLDDFVLKKVKRGHTVKQTIEATANIKDAFLKVGYHIMPGLYSNKSRDALMAKKLFADSSYRPDMLKIYPTLVLAGTQLFNEWRKGRFSPYSTQEAAQAIAKMKKFVPPYCRIMRVDRDIPSQQIAGGVKNLNLRQLVQKECKQKGIACQCIRCREIGLNEEKNNKWLDWSSLHLETIKYDASNGKEFFIQLIDDQKLLAGFARLRFPDEVYRSELDNSTAGIRELRVFGTQVPVDSQNKLATQHKGLGKKLLEESQEICVENGFEKLVVTSGVGAREYYKKQGFSKCGAYVKKLL